MFCISCMLIIATPRVALAHPFNYGAIKTNIVFTGRNASFHMEVPQHIGIEPTHGESNLQLLNSYFTQDLQVTATGKQCAFALTAYDYIASTTTTYDGSITCPARVTSIDDLTIHSALFDDFFANFDDFTSVTAGDDNATIVFTATNEDYPKNAAAVPAGMPLPSSASTTAATSTALKASASSTAPEPVPATTTNAMPASSGKLADRFLAVGGQFLWMGMMHIWTGYDHILFLISIILLLRSLKKILILVTSFTVAHSVTLLLAGLHVVTLSPRIVEPLIALTIAYMALRNVAILRRHGDRAMHLSERWLTTSCFGLIHGLGFAGALLETNVPTAFVVPSLVMFNVGIEIGQLAILAVIVPLLMHTDRLHHRNRVLISISLVIAALAIVWFFQRIM